MSNTVKPIAVSKLKPGHVVMESHEFPAVVTRVVPNKLGITVWARYPWQASTEPDWRLGRFNSNDTLHKVVERGY
ncbi:hypothetical protein [Leifsonia aquatica]|uniref:hypothetical protein n=1 Tax=Leifsonia aquatica TaxID=144185 RepID=UPI0037FC0398